MLTEELLILDAETPLWNAVQPLLDAALRLEQNDDTYSWHGWDKRQINTFLKHLPAHCVLLAGVWETAINEDGAGERESLVVGCVCEVVEGEVCSIRTFESLVDSGLLDVKLLEPGYEHALEIMRAAKKQVAPVAWALFTDKTTWDEWIFSDGNNDMVIDKGELLSSLARQGRCVLMGNQTAHHNP